MLLFIIDELADDNKVGEMYSMGERLIWGVFILFSALGGFLLCSSSAKAETSKIIISEVQYHPENPSGVSSEEKDYEWFELYNPGDIDFDLKGWSIKDNSTSNVIPDLTIKSHDYAVVVAKKSAFEANFPGLNINLVELLEGKIGNGLANSADELSLFDDQDTLVDRIAWTKDWGLGVSISRDETTGELNKISPPHPGFVPIVQIYSNDLKINEILPNPETGNDEFVELVNLGDQAIDLKNWQIDDAEGGSTPFTLSGVINPKSYLLLYQTQTKIFFNNDGDIVRLFDPNGGIKDSISYGKVTKGQSYSQFSDGWSWTKTSTPGADNIKKITTDIPSIILADQPPASQSIETAKTLELDKPATISGQATVPPGVLSNQYFYLEDSTGGIQIYDYGKDFPEIKEGYTLSVTGTLSETRGEKRLKIENASSITITNSTETAVAPEPVDQPTNNLVGRLISLKGKISKNSGSSIYLENQDPSFRIYILTQTGIKKPRLHQGDEVEISGILSYYQSYYRLLPRYQEDIKIVNSADTLPESGLDVKWILILAGFMTLIFYGKSLTQLKRNRRFRQRLSWQSSSRSANGFLWRPRQRQNDAH